MKTNNWSNWNLEFKNKELTSTLKETLNLFLNGKTIKEITQIRDYKQDTIERQIIKLITKSFININQVINNKKNIIKAIDEVGLNLSNIKSQIPEASWFEIKCTIAYLNSQSLNNKELK